MRRALPAVMFCMATAAAAPPALHPQTAAHAAAVDAAMTQSMARWRVPGAVVVIVKAGAPAYVRGYGTRAVDEELQVDERTLVHIASHTKAVTATALAMLVDAGALAWDDPVRRHIPEFAVSDAYATEHVTVRDLVAHRSGLPAPAIGGFRAAYGVDSLLALLRGRPAGPFRARQAYSQGGIALAGEVVARVTGRTWEQFVRERIFEPLAMRDSYTSISDLRERFGAPAPDRNVFMPARLREGELRRGTWAELGTNALYAPAGGIATTGADMAKWIAFLVRDGATSDGRLLSAAALHETRVPVIPVDDALRAFIDPIGPLGAATLGWSAVNYSGRAVYFAAGGWMSSVVALVPDAQLGVGIFTNAYFSERHSFQSLFAAHAMTMRAIDAALGLAGRDWDALYEGALDRATAATTAGRRP
jgi:CubicO group peptidase (beta-lactamase class C family)